MPRLLLVDGHSNLYRAFYAIRTPLSAPDGTPTGAAFGFLRMQHKMLRDLAPTHVAVAFDSGGETFRSRLDGRYKAQRPPMPDDLRVQVPLTLEAVRMLGLAVIQQEEVEADDVIGTLAVRAAAQGFEVVIATTDKDLMQLVRDPSIRLWHTRHERMLDEAGVEDVFGVPPSQVAEVLAIMGDASDNVPGCPGIGEKGARELIRRWGSVEEVYRHLDEVTPPRQRALLGEHRAEVGLSRTLVAIRTDLELPLAPFDLALGEPDRAPLATFYRRLGFSSLLAEIGEAAAPATAGVAAAEVTLEQAIAALESAARPAIALDDDRLAIADGERIWVTRDDPLRLADVLLPHLGRCWCHDAKALIGTLRTLGIECPATPNDTMLAGYLLSPGETVDLAALCARHAVAPPDGSGPERIAAAVADLAENLSRKLDAEHLTAVYEELERPLVAVLEDMERVGILLDLAALAELSARLERSLGELERDIHAEAGGSFNVNSPTQLGEVLFERKGLPVIRRTAKTKAPSTDADVLAELAGRGYRLPALILEFREQAKLKSTYVDALPRQVAADGRVHTRFNQAVAATGRLSSSDPNLQNIPVRSALGREVRRAFVAPNGHLLLAADYSQIELRVLAHLSGDPNLRQAFAAGVDIHRATAALVFNVAPELVSADHRRAAKTINFGLIYGMGAFALARELGVSNAEAQSFIDAYFARLPRVRDYLEQTKRAARDSGKVTTMFGRVRWIAGLDSRNAQVRGNAERMAINAPVQGTAADLMKLAMIELRRALALRGPGARMLLQVHDELVLETASDELEGVSALVRSVMEGVGALDVPMRVDSGAGPTWADAKE
ncbi:MAG: DNA polymerase I [Acidobacteriota bacterium]